jgi:hypothetical protein
MSPGGRKTANPLLDNLMLLDQLPGKGKGYCPRKGRPRQKRARRSLDLPGPRLSPLMPPK